MKCKGCKNLFIGGSTTRPDIVELTCCTDRETKLIHQILIPDVLCTSRRDSQRDSEVADVFLASQKSAPEWCPLSSSETMDEYIKREAVLELIKHWMRNDVVPYIADYSTGWNEALEQLESDVMDMPSISGAHNESHEQTKETETVIIDGKAVEMEIEDNTPTVTALMEENAALKRVLDKIAAIIEERE